jgi:hypothetical protein
VDIDNVTDIALEKICSNPRDVYWWLINLDDISDGIRLLADYDSRHNPLRQMIIFKEIECKTCNNCYYGFNDKSEGYPYCPIEYRTQGIIDCSKWESIVDKKDNETIKFTTKERLKL